MHNLVDGSLEPRVLCDFNEYQRVEIMPTEDWDTKQLWKIMIYLFILDDQMDSLWKYDDCFPKLTLHDYTEKLKN